MQDSTIEALISGMAAGLSGLSPLIEESTDTMGSVRSLLGDVSEKIIPVDVLSSVIPPSSDAVKSPIIPIPTQSDVVMPKSRDDIESEDLVKEPASSSSTASGDTYITNNNYYSASSSADNSNISNSADNRVSNNSTKTDISSNYVDRSDSVSEITNNSLTRISSNNSNATSFGGDTISLKSAGSLNENTPPGEVNDAADGSHTQPQAPIRVDVVLPPTMQPSAASMNSYVDSSGNTVTYVSGSTSRIEGGSNIMGSSQSVINARSESSTSNVDNSVTTQQDVYMPRGEIVEKSYHSDRESRDSEIRELVKEIHIKSAESAPDMSGEIINAIRVMTETISSRLDQIVTYSRVQAKQHNEMIH